MPRQAAAAATAAVGSTEAAYQVAGPDGPPSSNSPTWIAMANDSGSARRATTNGHSRGMATFGNTSVCDPATKDIPTYPTEDASTDELKAWVEHQLDKIGSTPLLNRFVLLGPRERRRGGTLLATSASVLIRAAASCVVFMKESSVLLSQLHLKKNYVGDVCCSWSATPCSCSAHFLACIYDCICIPSHCRTDARQMAFKLCQMLSL
jgi:hypothetical protein